MNAHRNKTASGFYTGTIVPCLYGFSESWIAVVFAERFTLGRDSVINRKRLTRMVFGLYFES